jgi:hypothetical protein
MVVQTRSENRPHTSGGHLSVVLGEHQGEGLEGEQPAEASLTVTSSPSFMSQINGRRSVAL